MPPRPGLDVSGGTNQKEGYLMTATWYPQDDVTAAIEGDLAGAVENAPWSDSWLTADDARALRAAEADGDAS